MSMAINHNLQAMNTTRQLGVNQSNQSKSLEKLSSGQRINKAADDAAGLAISEKMRAQIRGLQQASRNAQDGISMIQTAEGALNETQAILQRMRELAVQSANDTNVTKDRSALQAEITQLKLEIDRIASTTTFNTKKLLNGSLSGAKFQIGADANITISLTVAAMCTSGLSIKSASLGSTTAAQSAITVYNTAINSVSTARAKLGAIQNRLEHTIQNLDTSAENLQASESRIRDVDMAKEMAEFTKNNILNQAATSMLAQANQQPQSVLSLLR